MVLAVASVVSCHRVSRSDPAEIYRQARLDFERGELTKAGEEAERGFRETRETNPESALGFLVLQGEVLAWQGKPKESLALLEAAPPQPLADSEAALRRLIVLGTADYLAQRFDEAAKNLTQAEALASRQYPALLGDVIMAQATLATYQRNYAVAEKLNLKVFDIARRSHRSYLEATALGSLGFMALRQQHFDASIDWFAPALAISKEIGNQTLSAKILGNLGWCYFKLGDYERSAAMFAEAEELSVKLGLVKDQFLWLTNIGSVHYEQRDYKTAADYYQKALAIARGLDNKPGAAACLTNLANVALETKDYDDAERLNREALALKHSIGDRPEELSSLLNQARIEIGHKRYAQASALLKQIVTESADNLSLQWQAESELADAFMLMGNNQAAETQFKKSLLTIDRARASLTKEEHRLSFLESAESFYNDYIDFLIARGHTRAALRVTEHSRARTLAEGLNLPVAGLAEAGFNPERTARRTHEIILSYWLKPGASYLWVVTPSRVDMFSLPAADEIETQVGSYRKAILGPRDPKETADTSGTALFHALVEPAQPLIPQGAHVTIVGSGALNTLSFATLLVPKPELHYWIEDVTLANASSIALLSGTSQPRTSIPGKLLLIGNPTYSAGEYPELRQAQIEVSEISQHFAVAQRTVLEGPAATPAAYMASGTEHFSYIHFVAHAIASRTSPLDSSIVLSSQADQSKLYARDIMKEPLRADLVTISACYGAGNRSYSGEGLVGLSWAFLRAGAHHVVAALWEVSDNSTPRLMDAMYGKIVAGWDPVTALRDAQLTMLHSDGVYRRPFYWGTFQVYAGRQ